VNLINELRRRHVFRAIAWYAAAAWVLIQVVSTVAPQFGLPDWVVRAVIIAAVAGFPIAALLAWSFDLTRAGVKLTEVSPEVLPSATPARGILSLLLAVVAGALLGIAAVTGWQALEAPSPRPGIAVLAFDTLGQESNRVLAGGLHEAVLDELAHISGLRVIARTSVLRFTEERPDVRELRRILDVPFVLEGSVMREGEQLRVHAQLIDVASNAHVWSESYDRAATDIFGVQTALARDIAKQLHITLLPDEVMKAEIPPTVVPAAYELLLTGKAEFTQYNFNGEYALLQSAITAIDQALALDPEFALAHAEKAQMEITLWWRHRQAGANTAAARERALLAATEAIRLEPDLGEAHRALGLYYYWGLLDYSTAERELNRARELLPNDSISISILGWVRRRQGRFDEAVDLLRLAYRLNPAENFGRADYVLLLVDTGRYARAKAEVTDMLARFPEDHLLNFISAWLDFCHIGETREMLEAADAGFDNVQWENFARWLAARYDGRFDDALAIVQASPGDEFGFFQEPRKLALAQSYFEAGDLARAAETANEMFDVIRAEILADPAGLGVHKGLANAYLYAGRPDDAREAAQAHLDETPLELSAIEYYGARFETAMTYAALGDTEAALELLNITQRGPLHECGNALRRDPAFASLRGDPRFEELAALSDWK